MKLSDTYIKVLESGMLPNQMAVDSARSMYHHCVLLEKKAEIVDKIMMLKNSAIQIEVCPEHGRTFSGAFFSEDKRFVEHSIQDTKYIEEVLDFLLKHEAEAARLAERKARAEAPQTDFAPPVEERRQGKTLGEIVAEEVKKQLSGLPDGTLIG